MGFRTPAAMLAAIAVALLSARGQQPLLQLQGLPYSGGSMTLHVTAPSDVGDLVWLGVGLDPLPLDAPVPTNKGTWYVGNLLVPLLIGSIPSDGQFDMPFTKPAPAPGAEGIALARQAYVSPNLLGSTGQFDHDVEGDPRIQDGYSDIGADETEY